MIHRHTVAPFIVTLTFLLAAIGLLTYATHVRAAAGTVTVKNYPASGGGTIGGEGIDCGGDCSEYYADGATVTLTASPAAGRVFAGWDPGGACRNQGATCQFNMNSYYGDQITAYWGFTNYTVNVVKEGSGSGTVSGGGGGYGYHSTATLTATPASGSVFAGWQTSGYCATVTGKGGVEVNMNTTCQLIMQNYDTSSYDAVVKFDAAPASSGGGSTGGGGTTGGSATPAPSATATPAPTTITTETPVTELAINGQTDVTQNPIITANTITLSGKTTPNADVTLYIFSEPQTIKTKADGEGVWTATVAYIENGEHRVEAEVVDPTTGQTSARTQIAAFTVAAAPQPAAAETAKPADSPWIWYVVGGLVLLAGAAISGVWWIKKHKQGSRSPSAQSPAVKPDDAQDDFKM